MMVGFFFFFFFFFFSTLKSGWERVWQDKREEREKIYKIINRRVTVNVHICIVTVAIVHKCTILYPLIGVSFCSKCVKWEIFSIMQDFTHTDANALSKKVGGFDFIYILVVNPCDARESYWKINLIFLLKKNLF